MPKVVVGTSERQPVELHYEDMGEGRPVVLIHGWPLSGRSWEAQVGPLVEAGHRVITYDRRGFGQSSQPWTGYDYNTFAADLDRLLQHLQVRDATLVGFSMGGGEVARYFGLYGAARANRAVFAAAVPPFFHKSPEHPDGGLDDETIAQLQAGVRADRLQFLEGFLTNFFSAGGVLKVSEPQRRYAHQIASFASPKAMHACIAAWATDFRRDLSTMRVPTLVIHGDSDVIVPFDLSGRRTHEAIPGAKLALLRGAPHGCSVSHAREFNEALLEFVSG